MTEAVRSESVSAGQRRRAVLAIVAALLVWGRAARDAGAADEPAPIQIDVETCPSEWEPEFRLALAVELGDERLAGGPTDEQPAAPALPPGRPSAATG